MRLRKKNARNLFVLRKKFSRVCWRNNSQTGDGKNYLDEHATIPKIDSQHLHRVMNSGVHLDRLRIGVRIDPSRPIIAHGCRREA
jgi:hypothetical protein